MLARRRGGLGLGLVLVPGLALAACTPPASGPQAGSSDTGSAAGTAAPSPAGTTSADDPMRPDDGPTLVASTSGPDDTTSEGLAIDATGGATPPPRPSWPAFEDVSAAAGIDATHTAVLGHHAIGQAFGDYDRDGLVDLYVTGGTDPSVLYHNEGDGTFTPVFAPVVSLPGRGTGGAAWGDYDNDGWLDLYVTTHGEDVLLRNDDGMGFSDVSVAAGIADPASPSGYGVMAAWGDYDGDGWLDLYVACHHTDLDALYHNEGDGTFTDVTELLGQTLFRPAFAMSFLDYDDDGDLDLHIVNDHIRGNRLLRNDGAGCGGWCLTDVSDATGTGLLINGMGQAIGDVDNDGDLDLFMSDIGTTHFLRGLTAQGVPAFETAEVGLGSAAISWGTFFFDFDDDGWLDAYLATTDDDAPNLTNRLFHNRGDGTFADVSSISGAANAGFSYGAVYGDYDDDGYLDVVVGNRDEGYVLYRNTTTTGPGHHFIGFELSGGGPINRDAIGTRVTVTDTEGRTRMAERRSGSTMGGGNDLRLHFGLGSADVASVHVRWPDGLVQTFEDLPADTYVTLAYPRP